MKASIRFREDQRPLFKAKLPLPIAGIPIQSEFIAGEKQELGYTFHAILKKGGPSFKLSYHPNDSSNRFTFDIKAALGHSQSSLSDAPLIISASVNLVRPNKFPTLFLRFKPQLGDFFMKKSVHPLFFAHKEDTLANDRSNDDHNVFKRAMFSGLEVTARTSVPVRRQAMLRLSWNMCFFGIAEIASAAALGNNTSILKKIMPCLVLKKVGIEHVGPQKERGDDDVEGTCLAVNKKLDALQVESALVRKGVEELRSNIISTTDKVPLPDAGIRGQDIIDIKERKEEERSGGGRGFFKLLWRGKKRN